jgi:uncharacterized protein (UPF0210 family)
MALEPSPLPSASLSSIPAQNRGASAFVEDLKKNECKTRGSGRKTAQVNEAVADAGDMQVARGWLPAMEK